MQKNVFTRIKISFVKFRDTYFTGVQRIFRYSQRLETKLDEIKARFEELENKIQHSSRKIDELRTLHFALNSETQNLKIQLEYSKINQALINLEEKFTRKKDFDLNTFILFDYSHHIHANYHNLGDFVQSIAVKNALEDFSYSKINFFDRDSLSFYPCYGGGGFALCKDGLL